jgi:2,3-bisphosphoglycerate-independent phosphoglycerate mutase
MAKIVAEVLADCGRTQLRTAETEKYPTSPTSSTGIRAAVQGEERSLVPSQKVATYDLAPR